MGHTRQLGDPIKRQKFLRLSMTSLIECSIHIELQSAPNAINTWHHSTLFKMMTWSYYYHAKLGHDHILGLGLQLDLVMTKLKTLDKNMYEWGTCPHSCPPVHQCQKVSLLKDTTTSWVSCCQLVQHEEVVLASLRVGHTCLTHPYLLQGEEEPWHDIRWELSQCSTFSVHVRCTRSCSIVLESVLQLLPTPLGNNPRDEGVLVFVK